MPNVIVGWRSVRQGLFRKLLYLTNSFPTSHAAPCLVRQLGRLQEHTAWKFRIWYKTVVPRGSTAEMLGVLGVHKSFLKKQNPICLLRIPISRSPLCARAISLCKRNLASTGRYLCSAVCVRFVDSAVDCSHTASPCLLKFLQPSDRRPCRSMSASSSEESLA